MTDKTAYTPATLDELRETISLASCPRKIDSVPRDLLAQLLDLLTAAHEASRLLESGKAAAARRLLNLALNQIPAR